MSSSIHPRRKDRPCDACRKRKSRCHIEKDSPSFMVKIVNSYKIPKHVKEEMFKMEMSRLSRRNGLQQSLPRYVCLVADKKHRRSVSSLGSGNFLDAQTRVIRTSTGTGVEEYDDLEEGTLLRKTLGLQNKHHSQYVGSTRGIEPALLGELSGNMKAEFQLSQGTLRRVNSREAFILTADPETQGYTDELEDLDSIESIVRPHGKPLVDLYFRVVFPSFPILHKEVYLEKYGRSYKEFSPPLLAAVYLLALNYWSYDDHLGKSQKPDVQNLELLARKALRDTIHRPKLSTVQAGLLLLQHTDTDAAELTAQLVSVGYGLGLHLDTFDWSIPLWEKGLRKRLGWALYIQDKFSSLGSGRPPLINSANWALQAVTDFDFPETLEDDQEGSSEVEKGRIIFTHMISLSQILSELLETVFTVKASKEIEDAGESGLRIVLDKVKPIQLKLKNWFSTLPECLSMDVTHVMKLSSVGYLRLAYLATEITLHRRIILALSSSSDPQIIQICRASAHERFIFAIEFVQSLKPQHLSSFWYFASPHNFALIGVFGTLLLSTASSSEEAEFYRTKLREYRWILKINSENGAKYMKPAMTFLDTNLALLEEAENIKKKRTSLGRNSDADIPFTNIAPLSSEDDYALSNVEISPSDQFALLDGYSFENSYYQG